MEYIEVTGRTMRVLSLKQQAITLNMKLLKKEATVYSVFLIQSQQRLRQELRLV